MHRISVFGGAVGLIVWKSKQKAIYSMIYPNQTTIGELVVEGLPAKQKGIVR